jgi:hypothetical protein
LCVATGPVVAGTTALLGDINILWVEQVSDVAGLNAVDDPVKGNVIE